MADLLSFLQAPREFEDQVSYTTPAQRKTETQTVSQADACGGSWVDTPALVSDGTDQFSVAINVNSGGNKDR